MALRTAPLIPDPSGGEGDDMRLSTTAGIVLGLLSLVPAIYMALFFASFVWAAAVGPENDPFFENFGIFLAIHLGVLLLMFGLLAFYVVFLFKTPDVKAEMKALWAIVLFFGGPVAMPVFWYLYVWSSRGEDRNPLRRTRVPEADEPRVLPFYQRGTIPESRAARFARCLTPLGPGTM